MQKILNCMAQSIWRCNEVVIDEVAISTPAESTYRVERHHQQGHAFCALCLHYFPDGCQRGSITADCQEATRRPQLPGGHLLTQLHHSDVDRRRKQHRQADQKESVHVTLSDGVTVEHKDV